MWEAHEGMVVVCVNDEGFTFRQGEKLPVKGTVYTLRTVEPLQYDDGEVVIFVRLNEIKNPTLYYSDPVDAYIECGFNVERFRPCKETDISVFTKLLKKVEEKV